MILKNNLLLAFGLLLSLSLFAQNLQYSECGNCADNLDNEYTGNMDIPENGWGYQANQTLNDNPDRVVSDFGRREEGTSWHIGLDFSPQGANNDLGDILYPIETGTINQIRVSENDGNYKYIQVDGAHHFAYGHIFFDGVPGSNGMRCGSFILKALDGTRHDNYAIIYCPEEGDPIAYGAIPGSTVTHPDINDGVPMEVTTTIDNINTPLCPVGNSGGDYSGHLHLYSFEEEPVDNDYNSSWNGGGNVTEFRNPKDPLDILTYPEPAYDITIDETQYLTTDENGPFYSGTLESAVKVVCQMEGENGGDGYQTVMDINSVELFYKSPLVDDGNEELQNWGQENSYYNLFQGPYFESKICVGATIGTERYPSPGYPENNTIDIANPNRQGSLTRTGINGVCYNTGANDEFFFQDIVTRIHKDDQFGHGNRDLADYPGDARTNDGPYELYVRTQTVKGDLDCSDQPYSILIDNFRPYISSVKIYRNDVNGELLYHKYWEWINGQLTFQPEVIEVIHQNDNLYIEVEASEPMQQIGLSIPLIGFNAESETPVSGTAGKKFGFEVTGLYGGTHDIHITGTDYADNGLQTDPSVISIRQSDGSWSPPPNEGTDQIHDFFVGSVQPPVADFSPSEMLIYVGDEVDFMDESTNNPNQWHWDFGDGNYSDEQNPAHTYTVAGDYYVTLTASNDNGQSSKTEWIEVKEVPVLTANFSATPKHTATGTPIQFNDNSSSPNSTIVAWQWQFNGANTETSYAQNPSVTYDSPGSYDVQLTITDDDGKTDTKYITDYISIYEELGDLDVYCNVSSFSYPGQSIPFALNFYDGVPPYDYTLTVNGSIETQGTTYDEVIWYNTILPTGNNHYSLTVEDDLGRQGSDQGSIQVGTVCSHNVDFDFYFENTSGLYQNVIFTDLTSGGLAPYTEWLWTFGNEMGSGASPITSSGSNQQWINNFYGDPNVNGNPTIDVSYPEYGTYPITLTVYDQEGCPQTITKYLSIQEQASCFTLYYFTEPIGIYPSDKIAKGHFAQFADKAVYLESAHDDCVVQSYNDEPKYVSNIVWEIENTPYQEYTYFSDPNNPVQYTSRQDWWYSSLAKFYIDELDLEQGHYEVRADIWNDLWEDNNYAPYPPGTAGDHKWFDSGSREFTVIDCDLDVEINDDINAGDHEIVYGGSISISSTGNVNINDGANIGYEACSVVDLNAGTDILSGADFEAKIEVSCNDQINGRYQESNKSMNIVNVENNDFEIYPNPSKGLFHCKLNSSVIEGNSQVDVQVFNQVGALVLNTKASYNSVFTIDLSEFKNGAYFVRAGSEVAKIILLH